MVHIQVGLSWKKILTSAPSFRWGGGHLDFPSPC